MLGWLLENTLLACLLALPMLAIERRLRARPAVCHTIWLTVLAVLMLPPAVFSSPVAIRGRFRESLTQFETAVWQRLDRLDPTVTWSSVPAPPPHPRAEPIPDWDELDRAYFLSGPLNSSAANPPSRTMPSIAAAPALTTSPSVPARASAPAPREFSVPGADLLRDVLRSVWLGGAAVSLMIFLRRVRRIDRAVRRAAKPSARLSAHVACVARRLGVRSPQVRTVPGVGTPMVWGLGRPVLLWPEELDCSEEAAAGLVAHELAHLRRRDHWTAFAQVLATALLWWHPIARLALHRLERYAELACDAWAVRAANCGRRDYAEAIINVVERLGGRRVAVPAASGGGKQALVERLWVVMANRANAKGSRLIFAAGVAMVALLLPTISTGQTERPRLLSIAEVEPEIDDVVAYAAAVSAGDEWYEARQWARAEGSYRTALRLREQESRVSARLGITLFHLGELNEAEQRLSNAIQLGGREAELQYWLGAVAAGRGDEGSARERLAQALRKGIDVVEKYDIEPAFDTMRGSEASSSFEQQARRVHELRSQARDLMRKRDAESARAALEELATLCPEDGATWHFLSYCDIALGRLDDAQRALDRQKQLGHRLSVQAYNQACLSALRGDARGAVAAFERAVEEGFDDYGLARDDPDLTSIRQDPRFVRALERVTSVEKVKRELALAHEFYEWARVLELCDAAEKLPGDTLRDLIARERAGALAELGRTREAEGVLVAAMQSGMDARDGLVELARVQVIAGEIEQAAACMREAARCGLRDAERVRADARLAPLLARPEISESMVSLPQRDELMRFGVRSWDELKNRAEAVLAQNAGDRTAMQELGWARLRMGDYAGAEAQFRTLDEVNWNRAVSGYNIACSVALQGRGGEAIAWLNKAVDAGMTDVELLLGDRDLAMLRDRDDFRAVVQRMRTGGQ